MVIQFNSNSVWKRSYLCSIIMHIVQANCNESTALHLVPALRMFKGSHWSIIFEMEVFSFVHSSSLSGLNKRYRYMNHHETNIPMNSSELGRRGSLSMAVIRLADARNATMAANPKPARAIRSSELLQALRTYFTMFPEDESELSSTAMATTILDLCLPSTNKEETFRRFLKWVLFP